MRMLDDVQRVVDTLAARRLTLAIAEGDTGGLLLEWLTAVPGGATPSKPVGLAFVAAVGADRGLVREHRWPGERESNRQASAHAALRLTLEMLRERDKSERMC